MTSSFAATTCRFDGDTYVDFVAWSNVDQIAAMATNTLDENEHQSFQILFMNNEVSISPPFQAILSQILKHFGCTGSIDSEFFHCSYTRGNCI